MQVNHVPKFDNNKSETGCCPKFDPEPWQNKTIVLKDKSFVKARCNNFMHVPLNLGKIISETWEKIEKAKANDDDEFLLLTVDTSPWKSELYFWTTKEVAGLENVKLSGTFKTKVFEGDYKDAKFWYKQMQEIGHKAGKDSPEVYFYYTTCPKCAKFYGKNYTVGLVKV